MLYYNDKGTKQITHILDLQVYGVTKKWVIIMQVTEISKEVENNNIIVVILNAYSRQYVSRGVRAGDANGVAGES